MTHHGLPAGPVAEDRPRHPRALPTPRTPSFNPWPVDSDTATRAFVDRSRKRGVSDNRFGFLNDDSLKIVTRTETSNRRRVKLIIPDNEFPVFDFKRIGPREHAEILRRDVRQGSNCYGPLFVTRYVTCYILLRDKGLQAQGTPRVFRGRQQKGYSAQACESVEGYFGRTGCGDLSKGYGGA